MLTPPATFAEAFHVVLEITNPLDTALKLGQLTVGGTWSDAPGARPEVETIPELVLEPGETRKVGRLCSRARAPSSCSATR